MLKQIFRLFTFLIFVLELYSCSSVYYVGQTETPVNIHYSKDTISTIIYIVPIGSKLLIKKKYKKYYSVVYNNYTGFSYNTAFRNYHKFNLTLDGNLYGYPMIKKQSPSSNSGGVVNVKGYYKKNGTYVQPHTRSNPSRKH